MPQLTRWLSLPLPTSCRRRERERASAVCVSSSGDEHKIDGTGVSDASLQRPRQQFVAATLRKALATVQAPRTFVGKRHLQVQAVQARASRHVEHSGHRHFASTASACRWRPSWNSPAACAPSCDARHRASGYARTGDSRARTAIAHRGQSMLRVQVRPWTDCRRHFASQVSAFTGHWSFTVKVAYTTLRHTPRRGPSHICACRIRALPPYGPLLRALRPWVAGLCARGLARAPLQRGDKSPDERRFVAGLTFISAFGPSRRER